MEWDKEITIRVLTHKDKFSFEDGPIPTRSQNAAREKKMGQCQWKYGGAGLLCVEGSLCLKNPFSSHSARQKNNAWLSE